MHRFSALLEDGVVKLIMTEPGGLGLTCSLVSKAAGVWARPEYNRS